MSDEATKLKDLKDLREKLLEVMQGEVPAFDERVLGPTEDQPLYPLKVVLAYVVAAQQKSFQGGYAQGREDLISALEGLGKEKQTNDPIAWARPIYAQAAVTFRGFTERHQAEVFEESRIIHESAKFVQKLWDAFDKVARGANVPHVTYRDLAVGVKEEVVH